MTIYFNAAKEVGKPNLISVKHDRVMEKDTIHLTELFWSATETKISFVGILGGDCVGIEDYNDKSFKPEGKKVAFSFLKDDCPVYNKDTRQTTIEPAGDEQKLVFGALSDSLNKLIAAGATCASAVMKPAASGILLQLYRSEDAAQKAMLSQFTASMFVFTPTEAKELSSADTDFINALVAQKPSEYKKTNGNGYAPKESEAERLNARWAFIQKHFNTIMGEDVLNLPQLMLTINSFPENESALYKATLAMLIQIITK